MPQFVGRLRRLQSLLRESFLCFDPKSNFSTWRDTTNPRASRTSLMRFRTSARRLKSGCTTRCIEPHRVIAGSTIFATRNCLIGVRVSTGRVGLEPTDPGRSPRSRLRVRRQPGIAARHWLGGGIPSTRREALWFGQVSRPVRAPSRSASRAARIAGAMRVISLFTRRDSGRVSLWASSSSSSKSASPIREVLFADCPMATISRSTNHWAQSSADSSESGGWIQRVSSCSTPVGAFSLGVARKGWPHRLQAMLSIPAFAGVTVAHAGQRSSRTSRVIVGSWLTTPLSATCSVQVCPSQ